MIKPVTSRNNSQKSRLAHPTSLSTPINLARNTISIMAAFFPSALWPHRDRLSAKPRQQEILPVSKNAPGVEEVPPSLFYMRRPKATRAVAKKLGSIRLSICSANAKGIADRLP